MKKFLTVLEYELKEYFRDKTYLIITIALALVGVAITNLPRFIDMSGFTGVNNQGEVVAEEQEGGSGNVIVLNTDEQTIAIYDKSGVIKYDVLEMFYPGTTWEKVSNEEDVKKAVEEQRAEVGFVVEGFDEYTSYLYNRDIGDDSQYIFNEALKLMIISDYATEQNLDIAKLQAVTNPVIKSSNVVLGKDSASNYGYSYILVIVIFMLIALYGQMIAVSVTNEKSNRSIEVLVTSTSPNSLLFGKVIASTIASLFQAAVIIGAIVASYAMNRELWGYMLDSFLNIPGEVLLAYLAFGLGGFVFYAFLYGAVGALVSKTEDISKASGGLMMVIMLVYFLSLVQLMNVDGMMMKVLSFLPFSSYSAMFARIAMGSVALWEIIVSLIILVVSIIGAGVLGAKIYRMGTLRYGNPIKFRNALKEIRKK